VLERAADVVLFLGRTVERASRPLQRMYRSEEPLDRYSLVHMASVAGDAIVAVALANSVFFSLPVGQARLKVALYLGLTMAPIAVAGPLLVPLLDRGGFRRAISFGAAAGRVIAAIYAAPNVSTLLLFPAAFVLLVLSKVHGITKNGLTLAYAPSEEGLVTVNARLGRLAAVSAIVAAGPAILVARIAGSTGVLYFAALAYAVAAWMNLRLPQPPVKRVEGEAGPLGRIARLATAAAGTAVLRGASGFLLFLLAFALRRSHQPTYWFGVLAAGATAGTFLGDVLAPRMPGRIRDESLVLGALFTAGVAGLLAFGAFDLLVLALFAALVGASTEFGRLAFQSLMQRSAPGGMQGRVFVRYEVLFQLAWVAGAFVPAIVPLRFRTGVLVLALLYLVFGISIVAWPHLPRRPAQPVGDEELGPEPRASGMRRRLRMPRRGRA